MVIDMLFRSIILLAVFAAVPSACTREGGNTINEAAHETSNVMTVPSIPVVAPGMGRAALLQAVAQAASAEAGGLDDGEVQRKLDGQQFEVRLRFGCRGPTDSAAAKTKTLSWRFDEKDRTLRLRATPDLSRDQPLPGLVAADAFEAVEGFWIPRPWLLQPGCPVVPAPVPVQMPQTAKPPKSPAAPKAVEGTKPPTEADSASSAPAATVQHRVGIAQFFSETDSRTLRRDGRPYEATKSLAEGQAPSPQGYDLVLSGRLKRLPDGRVIACRVEQAEQPPQCIVSADFDRVWIERPDTKETIAEWSAGG